MRRFLALLFGLLLAACASSRIVTAAPTPETFANLPGPGHGATVLLTDGRKVELDFFTLYDDAVCTPAGCHRMRNIVSVEYRREEIGALSWAVGLPLYGAATVMCATSGRTYNCQRRPDDIDIGESETATPEVIARAWLDGRSAKGDQVSLMRLRNPCAAHVPADIRTDIAAFDWIVANRWNLGGDCLHHVIPAMRRAEEISGADTYRDSIMRIDTLLALRARWDGSRCATPGPWTMVRLGPNPAFAGKDRKGDPAYLTLIEETLADPMSYTFDGDLQAACSGRISPETDWRSVVEWAQAHAPFAPAP